jgi:hypothetical protein
MASAKLYMLLLGCRPKGRNTEQHDIFFGIGGSLYDLIPDINAFWPEVKGNIHIDAWREVTQVDGYDILIKQNNSISFDKSSEQTLYFINLGGYKANEFDEYHYKHLTIAKNLDEAKLKAKETAFFKHTGFKGAVSQIDDQFGIDVDDIDIVKEILPYAAKSFFSILLSPSEGVFPDELHLGYLPLYKIIR